MLVLQAGVQETEQVALSPACSNCFRPLGELLGAASAAIIRSVHTRHLIRAHAAPDPTGVLEELVGGALVQLINHLSDPDEDADEAELALLAHKVGWCRRQQLVHEVGWRDHALAEQLPLNVPTAALVVARAAAGASGRRRQKAAGLDGRH
jgi:hypothetical protein